jgi:hypothetical protein
MVHTLPRAPLPHACSVVFSAECGCFPQIGYPRGEQLCLRDYPPAPTVYVRARGGLPRWPPTEVRWGVGSEGGDLRGGGGAGQGPERAWSHLRDRGMPCQWERVGVHGCDRLRPEGACC